MMSRWTLRLLPWLVTTPVAAGPAVAQSLAYSDAAAPHRVTLASAYHLRLESAWPQAATVGKGCRNGGDEIVEGELERDADGVYRGSFERSTLLLFCGAHAASGEACELVLEGEGRVAVRGFTVPDEISPSGSALRLTWRPSAGHGVRVRGPCSADFKRSMEEMYLSVAHGVELALPAGAGKRTERLEGYAWTVEVEAR